MVVLEGEAVVRQGTKEGLGSFGERREVREVRNGEGGRRMFSEGGSNVSRRSRNTLTFIPSKPIYGP